MSYHSHYFGKAKLLVEKSLWIIKRKYFKYNGYKPVGFGLGMLAFCDWIKQNTTITVENIFEIGANFAQDAEYIMQYFGIPSEQVYVFEPHPDLYAAIKKIHNFNAYDNAVYNTEEEMTFNIVPHNSSNSGVSSLFDLNNDIAYDQVIVKSIRMDHFMNNHKIRKIDFLKLDVEGATYEALEGFGERIVDVQAMHIEAEHGKHIFNNKKYFNDISELLLSKGFIMVYFNRWQMQSDSFWVRPEIYKYS